MTEYVAFAGYGNVGKDTAATCLIERGWTRRCFGDIIKRQLDPLCEAYLGFSAFTEEDDLKQRIRGVLEQWGEAGYQQILTEYMASLTPRTVNTRIVRLAEVEAWHERGGVIIWIDRPYCHAATSWEDARGCELQASGLIDHRVYNDRGVRDLHNLILRLTGVS